MRPLADLLKQESIISLAREAMWRARKRWHKKRTLAQLEESECPVTFRNVPYYKPDPKVFTEESRRFICEFADEICRGRIPFLGYGTVDLGLRPAWKVDFVSGLSWPDISAENRDCIRFDGSDVKVPYELSRLQFLPVLGKAHILSQDEGYREAAKALLSDWIENNPVGIGINWSLAMEAALRGMSICFLLNLFSPMRPDEVSWLKLVTRSLWQHFVYIEAHVEFSHLIRSNHYLSNLLGLYCISCFLEGANMRVRRKLYGRRVEAEIQRQVFADGGDYEASLGYHVLVTQMFTSAYLLMRACGITPAKPFTKKLRSMYELISVLATDSGQLPHFGDCDDGRVELLLDDLKQMLYLPTIERNSLRISNLCGLGKCLFEVKNTGALEDAKWYGLSYRHEIASVFSEQSGIQSRVFHNSGLAIVKKKRADILFFAARNGINGKGSHTHNDKLSFVFRIDGEEVLCDPGTGTYTRDPDLRNQFRVTAAHNTVMVDETEQNTIRPGFVGLFSLADSAHVSPIEASTDDGDLIFKASHFGYRHREVTHTRTIRLVEKCNKAVITDLLEGQGTHAFEINFQLARMWNAGPFTTADSEVRCSITGTRTLQMTVSGPAGLRAEQLGCLFSATYGCTSSIRRIRFFGKMELPGSVRTTLAWADESAAASA
jgi:Heparinase II/III-like protein/Heparinase II/III N-terminus